MTQTPDPHATGALPTDPQARRLLARLDCQRAADHLSTEIFEHAVRGWSLSDWPLAPTGQVTFNEGQITRLLKEAAAARRAAGALDEARPGTEVIFWTPLLDPGQLPERDGEAGLGLGLISWWSAEETWGCLVRPAHPRNLSLNDYARGPGAQVRVYGPWARLGGALSVAALHGAPVPRHHRQLLRRGGYGEPALSPHLGALALRRVTPEDSTVGQDLSNRRHLQRWLPLAAASGLACNATLLLGMGRLSEETLPLVPFLPLALLLALAIHLSGWIHIDEYRRRLDRTEQLTPGPARALRRARLRETRQEVLLSGLAVSALQLICTLPFVGSSPAHYAPYALLASVATILNFCWRAPYATKDPELDHWSIVTHVAVSEQVTANDAQPGLGLLTLLNEDSEAQDEIALPSATELTQIQRRWSRAGGTQDPGALMALSALSWQERRTERPAAQVAQALQGGLDGIGQWSAECQAARAHDGPVNEPLAAASPAAAPARETSIADTPLPFGRARVLRAQNEQAFAMAQIESRLEIR